ncbi:MAG: hypothetical protein KatS3mg077_3071 [Candidatus Binatia bacterium]|nr:MAG: hypothetical protein KatS3mg077_3071 [Candidatus Binatia bacterium]
MCAQRGGIGIAEDVEAYDRIVEDPKQDGTTRKLIESPERRERGILIVRTNSCRRNVFYRGLGAIDCEPTSALVTPVCDLHSPALGLAHAWAHAGGSRPVGTFAGTQASQAISAGLSFWECGRDSGGVLPGGG